MLFQRKRMAWYKTMLRVPVKILSKWAVNRASTRTEAFGSTKRKAGSGRPKTATTNENLEFVSTHVEPQEDNPGTHLYCRTMARSLGISESCVNRNSRRGAKVESGRRLRGVTISPQTRLECLTRAGALLQRFSYMAIQEDCLST